MAESILELLLVWITLAMIFVWGYYLRNERKKRQLWENIEGDEWKKQDFQ